MVCAYKARSHSVPETHRVGRTLVQFLHISLHTCLALLVDKALYQVAFPRLAECI